MKTKFLALSLIAAAFVGCNSAKNNDQAAEATDQEPEASEVVLANVWKLYDYATTDSVATANGEYLLSFNAEDKTFGMNTDCNSLGGQYIENGDSLKFDNIACTQMLCPDENVETAMKAILPVIDTYAIRDSVLLLRSDMRTMATFTLVKAEDVE